MSKKMNLDNKTKQKIVVGIVVGSALWGMSAFLRKRAEKKRQQEKEKERAEHPERFENKEALDDV